MLQSCLLISVCQILVTPPLSNDTATLRCVKQWDEMSEQPSACQNGSYTRGKCKQEILSSF